MYQTNQPLAYRGYDFFLKWGTGAYRAQQHPKNYTGSQVTWLRGNDRDRETEAPETTLPEVAAETPDAIVLPWRGRGNVIAAVGVALLEMVGSR